MRSPQRRALAVWTWQDLLDAGASSRRIRRRVDEGQLIRCGHGWYATASTPEDVLTALSRGRRLTCISALRHHGLWVPMDRGIHDAGRRAKTTSSAVSPALECRSTAWLRSWPDDEPILPLRESLQDAARCLDVEDLAIVLESGLNRRELHADGVEEIAGRLSARTRRRLGDLQTTAQSGTETRVRRHFEKMGVAVRPQHRIDGVGYIDMLVGEILVIECDSRQHHTGETAYQQDRRRDLRATLLGYRVVRLTWEDVMLRWEETARMLTELVRRGRHRGPQPADRSVS